MPLKKKKIAPKKKSAKKTVKKNKPAKQRKPAPKKPAKSKPAKKAVSRESGLIGKITHYFPHVNAAVVKLKASLCVGDVIRIKGHTTDFNETVTSIQIDRSPLNAAKKGDEIGLLVSSRTRAGDKVYKI